MASMYNCPTCTSDAELLEVSTSLLFGYDSGNTKYNMRMDVARCPECGTVFAVAVSDNSQVTY